MPSNKATNVDITIISGQLHHSVDQAVKQIDGLLCNMCNKHVCLDTVKRRHIIFQLQHKSYYKGYK